LFAFPRVMGLFLRSEAPGLVFSVTYPWGSFAPSAFSAYGGAKEEERYRLERESFFADILVVGANAITLDGQLLSVDGNGNRVAATIYGPKKVICVVGINKIVKDTAAAIERVHDLAAPVNAGRFVRIRNPKMADLPCVRTGVCVDCRHEWRICNYTIIISGAMPQHKGRINVVIVGEELGI